MLTHDVPTILNYEQASKHCEMTKPIRGTTNKIPLGSRRYYHDRHLIKQDDGVIEVHSWNSVLVKYHPDNRIEFYSLYYTSSRQIISALFRGFFTAQYANSNKMYICDVNTKAKYPYVVADSPKPLVFQWTGTGHTLVGERVPESKPYVKRKELSSVRQEYEPLINYCLTINKLAGGEYERKSNWNTADDIHERIKELRGQEITDENQEKFTYVYEQVIGGLTWNWYAKTKITDKKIKDYFTAWIKRNYTDEVMEDREVPLTMIVQ
jgi:hypothetical protein